MQKEIISVMKRYELKYKLTKSQVQFFQNEILKHMKIDKYGLTKILSVYYDTPTFSLINKSIEKPFFKEKIRLRSYGLAKDNTPVFLEIKRKNDRVVYKRRIVSTEEQVRKYFEEDEEFDKSQITRELLAFKEKYKKLEPKYLIIYDRTAYYQDDSDLRITLDLNPRYRTQDLNLHTSTDGIPLLNEGEAILEVKVQHSVPMWLAQLLNEAKIYQSSFSKVGTAHKRELSKNNLDLQRNSHICIKEEKKYGVTI